MQCVRTQSFSPKPPPPAPISPLPHMAKVITQLRDKWVVERAKATTESIFLLVDEIEDLKRIIRMGIDKPGFGKQFLLLHRRYNHFRERLDELREEKMGARARRIVEALCDAVKTRRG